MNKKLSFVVVIVFLGFFMSTIIGILKFPQKVGADYDYCANTSNPDICVIDTSVQRGSSRSITVRTGINFNERIWLEVLPTSAPGLTFQLGPGTWPTSFTVSANSNATLGSYVVTVYGWHALSSPWPPTEQNSTSWQRQFTIDVTAVPGGLGLITTPSSITARTGDTFDLTVKYDNVAVQIPVVSIIYDSSVFIFMGSTSDGKHTFKVKTEPISLRSGQIGFSYQP